MAETSRAVYGGGTGWAAAPIPTRSPRVSSGLADLENSPYASVELTLTSAQILAMRATPITLVAAPGAGKVLQFLGATLILDYSGTAYSENSGNTNFAVENATGTDMSEVLECTGFIDATADAIRHMVPAILGPVMLANEGLFLKNVGSAEIITGTSPIYAKILFAVHSTGL